VLTDFQLFFHLSLPEKNMLCTVIKKIRPDLEFVATLYQSIILSAIKHEIKTETNIQTIQNGRYNQAETALIVDLETQRNQLQVCNKGALTSKLKHYAVANVGIWEMI